jgi:hypothetical protein
MEDSIGSELKTLAIRLLSITPHSAACERTFSILGWIHGKARNCMMVSRLEAIGKIYLYNVSHQNKSDHHTVNTDTIQPQISYYGEDDDDYSEANSAELIEVNMNNMSADDRDKQVWAAVSKNFDLSAFHVSAANSNVISDATHEETVENNDTDEHNFSVHEVVSQFCSQPISNED